MNLEEILQSNEFNKALQSKEAFKKFIYDEYFGKPFNEKSINEIQILIDVYNNKHKTKEEKVNDNFWLS